MSKAIAFALGIALASSAAMTPAYANTKSKTALTTSKTTYVCSFSGFGRKPKCYAR